MEITIITIAVLSVYSFILMASNHRQARSLREIQRVVEDYYSMQIRNSRRLYAGTLENLNPMHWLSDKVSSALPKPMQVTEVLRVFEDVQALDLRTSKNSRIVVSPHPKKDLVLYDRRLKSKKYSKKDERIANFATRPILSGSRFGWGVDTFEVSMSNVDEFFDMEADVVGKSLGVKWNNPTRLYFHVVD